jgi:radical SAM superfamily enzyme YgiQ (UPF0313 family)
MKIVLTNLKFEKNKITNFRRQEHIGLGYIGAVAKKNGFDIEIINAQFEELGIKEVKRRVKQMNPKILGISIYEQQLDDTIDFLYYVKKLIPGIVIVAGGHYATFNAKELLENADCIDFIAKGECEKSFTDFLFEIQDNNFQLKTIKTKGFCYRKENKIIDTGYPEIYDSLDDLPYPIRAEMNRNQKITNISVSRGCHGACSFCSTSAFHKEQNLKQIRIRDYKNVVDEIESIILKTNAHHLFFTDDNFLAIERVQKGWIKNFVNEILNRKIKFVFNFDCRVDDIEEDIFLELKNIGLIGVFLGVESNSESTLELYNKNTSKEKNINAINLLRKMRIDYWIGNIIFHPLTKIEDIDEDIHFFEKIHYCLYFNYSNPISSLLSYGRLKVYKGTPLFEFFNNNGIIEKCGLNYDYVFKDKKVEAFYDFINEWKINIDPFVEFDPIHLVELANMMGKRELSSKIHSISRKYMKIDFKVIKEAYYFLNENEISIFKNRISYFINLYKNELKLLYNDLFELHQKAHEFKVN